MNRIILTGKLAYNPIVKKHANDVTSISFRLHVPCPLKRRRRYPKDNIFFCIGFNERLIKIIEHYCKSGDLLTVIGELEVDTVIAYDNVVKNRVTVIIKDISLLPNRKRDFNEEKAIEIVEEEALLSTIDDLINEFYLESNEED